MSLILKAAHFAREAHAKQKRKWSNRPYIEHCARVAAKVTAHTFATEERVAAAWLHDVIEDTAKTEADLWKADFPQTTIHLVLNLTNQYTKVNYPKLRREARKLNEFGRLSTIDIWAKLLKCWDRIDNLRDSSGAEAGFKKMYCEESLQLADFLEMNVVKSVSGLHLELYELTNEIREAAIEMVGHAPALFGIGEREHYPLDGPPGARGL